MKLFDYSQRSIFLDSGRLGELSQSHTIRDKTKAASFGWRLRAEY
jgi:hypothetical protein